MSSKLIYRDVAVGADEDAVITATGASVASDTTLLPDGAGAPALVTLEKNLWVLDGGYTLYDAQPIAFLSSALSGADTVLIESNHDEEMLRYGPYPVYLKRRILSDRGHLSNACCAELARKLALGGTRQIVLGHLSRENNTPALAMQAARESTAGLPVELYCAPVYGCLSLPVGEEWACSALN